VSERRNGTEAPVPGATRGPGELRAFLEQFWGDRLEALKREAEREETKKRGNDN
jgi:hypothetical protein